MTTYKLNFDQIRQDQRLDNLLRALERGFEKFGIDFYLVGAVSRDVWMAGIHGLKPRQTTGDIDFAVYINDKGIYEALKEYLITKEGFSPYRENPFVLIDKEGMQVDLLPFGAIEDQYRRVSLRGGGYVYVDGFKEVYDNSLPEVEMGGHKFKFCTLPGIVLLKMIAWEDRPEIRPGDIIDISDVLKHYFDMQTDEIYAHHKDIFDDERTANATLTELAARVMGREIKVIAKRDEKLLARIANLLAVNTADATTSKMAEIMVQYFDNTVEDNLRLLQHLKTGFDEQIE
jgi:predicted nucleotidyltransferase